MKRLLAQAIFVASGAMVSSYSLALGLGELNLQSSLNQPLKAEIELLDIKGLTEAEIKPALASQADFDRAGVDRLYFLTGIEFKVKGNKVELNTRQPVNEPFLNFILELNWPSGRVLREYTVLLDPPTFDEQNYQPLVASPQVEGTVVEMPAPTQPVLVNQWDEPAAPGSYKVQPNDTLWGVALQTRPAQDITPQQMMLAIQQENPDAFIGGNINRLKSHYVLNIPAEERIRAIKAQQAIAEVARQNNALAGAAQVDATGRTPAKTSAAVASEGGEVRLLTAQAAGSSNGSSGDTSENVQALENDLAIALENADKSQRENAELQSKLESLQSQVETLQKLVNLKSTELASLQSGAAQDTAVDFNYEQPVDEPAHTETDTAAVDGAETADAEATPVESAPALVSAEDEAKAKAEADAQEKARRDRIAALMAEQQQQQEITLLDELLADPTIPAGIAGVLLLLALLAFRALKKRKANAASMAQGDMGAEVVFKDFEANTNALDDFDNFELDEEPKNNSKKAVSLDVEEDNFAELNESSSNQPADVISEADYCISYGKFDEAIARLKEALVVEPQRSDLYVKMLEVYASMDDAQGFAETEEALSHLGDAAASDEAKKYRELLSNPIDLADDDFSAVDSAADALADEFADGLDFGEALDMDDVDSAPATATTNLHEENVPTLDEADNGLDFDLGDSAVVEQPTPAAEPVLDIDFDVPLVEDAQPAGDNSLDFDLGALDAEFAAEIAEDQTGEEVIEAQDVPELDNGLEFEIEEPTLNAVNAEEVLELDTTPVADVDAGLEDLESLLDGDSGDLNANDDLSFDLDDIKLEDAAPVESDNGDDLVETELADFSDDIPDFDLNTGAAETAVPKAAAPAVEEAAASDDDIDLDQLASADNEFDFLAGTDECATKLDLARAYIDMEDVEGARELLQEVVQEGSDEQKAQARELISNL